MTKLNSMKSVPFQRNQMQKIVEIMCMPSKDCRGVSMLSTEIIAQEDLYRVTELDRIKGLKEIMQATALY